MKSATQKEVIQWCVLQADYDKWDAIELYTNYDEKGLVRRESNVRPLSSRSYAVILWHTAKKLGWI